jgi:predicted GH43/DUF377 family glycosyl hydrolase
MYYNGEQSASSSYAIGMATSKDGVHWTKTGKVTIQSHGWDTNDDVIGGVAYLNGSYVALYTNIYGTGASAGTNIGIASSIDGVSWTPFTGNPIVTPAGSNSWDSFLIGDPMLVVVGDSYYVYYTGIGNVSSLTIQIGLAKLPATSVQMPEFPFAQLILVTSTAMLVLSLKNRKATQNESNLHLHCPYSMSVS